MILPFEKDVPMIFYHSKAFPLGIIEGNMSDKEVLEKWYATVCINCSFKLKADAQFNIDGDDDFFTRTGIIKRQYARLYKTTYARYNIDYSLLALDFLKQGFYITGAYNEKYIESSNVYHVRDKMHDYLLIGYDEEKKCFKAIGYNKDLEYDFFDVTFEAYNLSLEDTPYSYVEIKVIEFDKNSEVTINISDINRKLKYYIRSKNDTMRESMVYGLEAIKALKDYYVERYSQGENLDVRYSRGLMEHKELMMRRLNLLYKYGYIKNLGAVEDYEYVRNQSIILHRLCLKHNIKKSDSTCDKITKIMDEIVQHEKEILSKVVEELE